MSSLSRKNRTIGKRLKQIDKEIISIDREIESLSRDLSRSVNEVRKEEEEHGVQKSDTNQAVDELVSKMKDRDSRFANYLVSGLSDIRPLRHERIAQRNKALLMVVVVLVLAVWLFFRYRHL